MSLIIALLGGLVFRIRGGLPPSLPRPIDQLVFALPYGIAAWVLLPDHIEFLNNIYVWPHYTVALAVLTWIITTVAVVKGHGRNMDLGHYHKPNSEIEPEWYEFVLKPIFGKLSDYWYDVIGIGVSGLTYTLFCGLITLNPIIALSGLLKAPAYMIGWLLFDKGIAPKYFPKHFKEGTEVGEFLTGVFLWGSLILCL